MLHMFRTVSTRNLEPAQPQPGDGLQMFASSRVGINVANCKGRRWYGTHMYGTKKLLFVCVTASTALDIFSHESQASSLL